MAIGPAAAGPLAIWNFTGNGGQLSNSESFLDINGHFSLTATALSNESGSDNPVLHQNDAGLGVRIVNDGCFLQPCNELDNSGHDEAIVFDISGFSGSTVIKAVLLTVAFAGEDYLLLGNNSGDFSNGTCGAACYVGDVLASGSGNVLLLPILIDFGVGVNYDYLIATLPGGSGDSYRIAGIALEIPEPGMVLTFGLALTGLSAARRRRPARP